MFIYSHGDLLLNGIRLLLLNSIVHDGLSDNLYNEMFRVILFASGHIVYPMIDAMETLGLLVRRSQQHHSLKHSRSNKINVQTELQLTSSVAKLNLDTFIPVTNNSSTVPNETNLTSGKASKAFAGAVARLKLNLNDKSRYK